MKLIELKDPSREEDWKRASTYLRELADRFEKGEITGAVLVINDKENNCFSSWGHFDDRWHILGALEYAKNSVHKQP